MRHTNNLRQKIKDGGFWNICGKMFTSFSTLILGVFLARHLAPEEAGTYFYFMTSIGVLAVVAQFGIGALCLKNIAISLAENSLEKAKQITGNAIMVLAYILVIALLIFSAISLVDPANLKRITNLDYTHFSVLALVLSFYVFNAVATDLYRGFHEANIATFIGGCPNAFLLIAIFFGIYFDSIRLNYVLAATLVAQILTALIAIGRLRPYISFKDNSKGRLKNIFFNALPIWFVSLIQLGITQANIWFVGTHVDPAEFAIYSVSLRAAAFFNLVSAMIYMIFPAILAEMRAKGEVTKIQALIQLSGTLNLVVVTPIFCFICLFPSEILNIVYGAQYSTRPQLLIIFSAMQMFNIATGGMRSYLLFVYEKERFQIVAATIGAAITLTGTYVALKYGTILHAAMASLIGAAAQNILEMYFIKKGIGIMTMPTIDLRNAVKILKS